jgi:hypothetical protein
LAQTRINCCILSVILMFLSPPEPPKTCTLTPTRTTILATVLTPRQLAHQVGGYVKCDSGSIVARATRLITGASGTAPDGGVRFLGEFFIIATAFALGQVLNFGNLAYIVYCYGELRPPIGATPVGTGPPVPSSPPGLLGARLPFLARWVHHGSSLHPTLTSQRRKSHAAIDDPL